MQPRRMTGTVLRGVARAGRAPVVGPALRQVSLAVMGVTALRTSRLGDVRPYDAPLAGELARRDTEPGA